MDGVAHARPFRGRGESGKASWGDKDGSVENWTMGRSQPDEEKSEDCSKWKWLSRGGGIWRKDLVKS